MSRHIIPGRNPQHQIVVGWDRPYDGFFGQVIVSGLTDDEVIFWIGADYPRQVPTVADLARHMRPYADLDERMLATLQADKQKGAMD